MCSDYHRLCRSKESLTVLPTTTWLSLGWTLECTVANTETEQPTSGRWTDSYSFTSTCFMSSTFLGRTLRPGASVRSRSNLRLASTRSRNTLNGADLFRTPVSKTPAVLRSYLETKGYWADNRHGSVAPKEVLSDTQRARNA